MSTDNSPVPNSGDDAAAVEQAIRKCVEQFYVKAQKDALLGPVFEGRIADWDDHITRISDFWSRAILRTERYDGRPFPPHAVLPVEPEHFDRWVALFAETARETLKPQHAEAAIERAELVARSFQTALFQHKERG